jgi:SAM-dependent methyltransferase
MPTKFIPSSNGHKNAFGMKVREIREIVGDPTVSKAIKSTLHSVLAELGVPSPSNATDICMDLARSSQPAYEATAFKFLSGYLTPEDIGKKLSGRSRLIHGQISPWIIYRDTGRILDFGCGDGRVGGLLQESGVQGVQLTDVYRNPNLGRIELPFRLFRQGENVPFDDGYFTTTLALTVYHHSDDPVKSVSESARVTRLNGRVIVIESVYGVDGKELPPHERERISDYLALTPEQQFMFGSFFDHFYNKIVYDPKNGINVPFNFNTPQGWKEVFADHGLREEAVIHLGLDHGKLVPEYHTMHILRKDGV